ncbi:hypothetical protein PSHT_01313 [Puccinia striiformis]|uniref:Uncharacterized protein n=1 Tax=Puccinia striiformis TaxID=27350 RepID=A0A2S4WKW4_9BASI|nr:hypothetical protein PSHT_01313 [Puccinia striiformis]
MRSHKGRTKTGIQDDTIDDEDDNDTPQFISIRDGPNEAAIQRARQAQLALDKAVKAEDDGNDKRADFFYAIYHSLLPPTIRTGNPTAQPAAIISTRPTNLIDSSFSSLIDQKRPHPDGVVTEVRNLKFKWGVSNSHSDGGFAPYFHKNIIELKGFLPLTIFNKEWQARALAWNAKNQSKVSEEDKGLKYWGLKVPNEYAISFSDWTLNYVVFYETMRFTYRYETLGQWILLHKLNCDKILRKDGFMTALRYITFRPESAPVQPLTLVTLHSQIRTNAWQFKPIEDGKEYVSDFSKMKRETYEEAYGEARNNDELQPYEIGGSREKWDPVTGTRPTKGVQGIPDIRAPQQPAPVTPLLRVPIVPTVPALPSKPTQPRNHRAGNGYQGNNFNPSYARNIGRQGGRNRE